MSARGGHREITVGGRRVDVTRPGKELFPEDGITKGDLVDYYRSVAGPMLTHLKGRPLAMERYPDGYRGKSFFHKKVPPYFPDWIHRERVPKEGGSLDMTVCDDTATLAYLANQACLTPHLWLSRADHLDRPDRMIFDLDPPGEDFALVRETARELRELLAQLGLKPLVMTTGSRGAHVLVPLDGSADFDAVRAFAREIAEVMAARRPDRLTTEVRKNRRGDRLYLDVQRNAFAQTSVAPYAVRARPHAPVATPLAWDELDDGVGPRDFTLATLPSRLESRGDPWPSLRRMRRSARRAERELKRMR
ncbi:non-homologous end-joining DNA ligase [Streptomyces sp. PT12]|uniref:non-homologous end-joining DNA ligase n=1 Tax=Streptomyces sp. PT12 TaxID=1510197 RepID=UPI000DE2E001|nr:non-homologous end-joining DNA ligase [Streptomyces sp. PT12]RBM07289.1 ATP-dependent DNA ligase [Streptomyces sp. PT12]